MDFFSILNEFFFFFVVQHIRVHGNSLFHHMNNKNCMCFSSCVFCLSPVFRLSSVNFFFKCKLVFCPLAIAPIFYIALNIELCNLIKISAKILFRCHGKWKRAKINLLFFNHHDDKQGMHTNVSSIYSNSHL